MDYSYFLSFIIEHTLYIIKLILSYITLLNWYYWIYLVVSSNCLYVKMEKTNLNYSLNTKFYFFQFEIFIFALFYHWALSLWNTTYTQIYIAPGFILLNWFSWALKLFISKNGKNKFKLFSKYLVLFFPV